MGQHVLLDNVYSLQVRGHIVSYRDLFRQSVSVHTDFVERSIVLPLSAMQFPHFQVRLRGNNSRYHIGCYLRVKSCSHLYQY